MSAAPVGRRVRRLLVVLLPALTLALGPGVAAQAHPFGDPQTAIITAKADVVSVVWRVGGLDDLTLLGVELGVLPEDRVMLDGAIDFVDGDTEAVADSDEFHDYLLERIEVATDGAACAGTVIEVGDLEEEGARLEYTCPRAVASASVTVRTLTDLHPAYRTLASGPDGQRSVYESAVDTHEWALGSGSSGEAAAAPRTTTTQDDLGRSAAVQLGVVVGAVLLILAVGALLLRRRRAHPPSTPTL
ncbi:MAG TPA: hypothetical protein VFO49_11825 [Nocardioides sp.]|nr:hypothetical protein [Nocardioides sp.]